MRPEVKIRKLIGKLNAFVLALCIFPVTVIADATVISDDSATSSIKALPHTSADQMIKMVLGLLLVLAMIFFLAWMFKKYIGVGLSSNASLKVMAGVAVGQKERVVLIQAGERQILVGVAPGQVSMLHALEKGDEVTVSGEVSKGHFSEKLKNSLAGLEKK